MVAARPKGHCCSGDNPRDRRRALLHGDLDVAGASEVKRAGDREREREELFTGEERGWELRIPRKTSRDLLR